MVCSSHFKAKYVRFLIKYHLFIFCCVFIMTSICISFIIYKRTQINYEHLLRGFQAHGTKTSDAYRKLIALIRETQITHLYPHSSDSKAFQQTPYPSFNPHINPCTKRFYLSQCPILPYTELTFEFNNNNTKLFDDINTFKFICKLEWNLRTNYTNCSMNQSCCQFIGPVDLLFPNEFRSFEQCDNITQNEFEEYHNQWLLCTSSSSSLCLNSKLKKYLTYLESSLRFKIYLTIENDKNKLLHLYDNLYNYKFDQIFYLKFVQFDLNDEEILLNYFLKKNLYLISLTIFLYFFCLLLFVKNLFFILIISCHILLTFSSCFIIYFYLFHFPITILNYTSLTLYLFLILIDSFLWYNCWFINNHRRDDCTIQRIIENLLTQTFFYLMPKNLTAIIALVITFTNQIIAIQCFTVFSFLLILISFFISFTLYPASFIFILRYQSSIPTIEHLSYRFITSTTSCFIDRTIPCLIVRFKGFWLTLFTIISCFALAIIFQWPKLQYDVCRLTFDTLPFHFSSNINEKSLKSIDIDVTYYIGSRWEMPYESLIPLRDIPILKYNREDSITSEDARTFSYALNENLTQLMQFCSTLKNEINKKQLEHTDYHSNASSQILDNNSIISTSTQAENLLLNNYHCFGDLSSSNIDSSLITDTKFSTYIQSHSNQITNCTSLCSPNLTDTKQQCLLCLNSLYYSSLKDNDLILIKNGLRYKNDGQNPRYLFQTMNYKWLIETNLNNYIECYNLVKNIKRNFITNFYSKIFPEMDIWWTSEIFSSFAIMEQLQQEKYLFISIKFITILIFLTLFTGVLGIFVTLTTLLNFVTCIATLTLLNYKLTVENMSYFVIVLIVCSQYSVLYSISYKLAPTFFFQRENRTMYSLKQLCTTLFNLTFSIVIICIPCLFSSVSYLSKSAMVYIISSSISLIYSTFFLQSLLCFMGPSGHLCFFIPWRLKFTRTLNKHNNNHNDISLRSSSTGGGGGGTRRHHRHLSHHRMSTSSYFASSYFSQIFTGSTYFESEYGGINENSVMASRRRESSRSHQASHLIKHGSLLTGELIELYTPRASLAPHLHHNRYSRQSSVSRGLTSLTPARPLYISPSISPYSQLSIHSQAPSQQRTPSPRILRPSRSRSPRSFAPITTTNLLRPCYSAPRLHVPLHRVPTSSMKQNDDILEETQVPIVEPTKKTVMIIQRQDAIASTDDIEQLSPITNSKLSATARRNLLKATTTESGDLVWLKRSNSS
ncbi:unnamed protein product [Adineta steineri]|uniref:SSD domain-containing protein n=2 Tax=Adineta steineri TaxID=433720 RepID=A0A814GLB2_9BILA|nr:unnamed protein product [Adineta steineri]